MKESPGRWMSVYLSDTSSVYKVEFVLYDSQNQLYILDTVTRVRRRNTGSGIVTVPFDTHSPFPILTWRRVL